MRKGLAQLVPYFPLIQKMKCIPDPVMLRSIQFRHTDEDPFVSKIDIEEKAERRLMKISSQTVQKNRLLIFTILLSSTNR